LHFCQFLVFLEHSSRVDESRQLCASRSGKFCPVPCIPAGIREA
jgi:hypothetical protein